MFPRGYTTSGVNLWPGGVVEYNFVSDGSDSLKDAAFYVDDKVRVFFIMSRFMVTWQLELSNGKCHSARRRPLKYNN